MRLTERLGDGLQNHSGQFDSATSLQKELMELNEELGNYPSPITGCDEQFNYLLERRTELEKIIQKKLDNVE